MMRLHSCVIGTLDKNKKIKFVYAEEANDLLCALSSLNYIYRPQIKSTDTAFEANDDTALCQIKAF
jgi:hypothetical protein